MKHSLPITIIFLGLFVISQLIGLALISSQTDVSVADDGSVDIGFQDTTLIERPEISGFGSVLYIIIGVGIGTALLLLLAKTKKVNIWRAWFMLAVWLATMIAIGAIIPNSPIWIPLLVAAILTLWKVYLPNIYVQNITEVLMYSGIALLLAPILNVLYATIMLILFAAYDAYAVWKSKHMVKMAEFASDSNLFPGLTLSYSMNKKNKTKIHSTYGEKIKSKKSSSDKLKVPQAPKSRKTGILGGGDVVFPLLFAGTVLIELIGNGFSKIAAFNYSLIVVIFATLSLLYLFMIGKKDKFYPAMPFLTTGCLVGYGVLWLVLTLL